MLPQANNINNLIKIVQCRIIIIIWITYRISQRIRHGHVRVEFLVLEFDCIEGALLDQINCSHMWHIEHAAKEKEREREGEKQNQIHYIDADSQIYMHTLTHTHKYLYLYIYISQQCCGNGKQQNSREAERGTHRLNSISEINKQGLTPKLWSQFEQNIAR